jgi:peptidoglycan/LPS O-acetylase OafA/YrhL
MDAQSTRTVKLRYRPDIDGLRAIAVILVVLDHLRTRVTGGYVGVDVFFVISGYLISAHILSEVQAQRFSVIGFYEKRIRRIFPALLVMLFLTSLLAWKFLLPVETTSFAKSEIAAVLSVSNFLFWSQAGYFDAPSALKPLLHTWSLGVEEQFYVAFPLFILLVRRWVPRFLSAAIWSAAAISFALACIWVQRAPSTAFFWSPLRAWELLLGTLTSQAFPPRLRSSLERNVAAAIGLLLIVVPACLFTARTPFPGLTALPACAGTALLIAAGETGSSAVGRLLSLRPVVFLGLISYSLYLWHWPIIVFWNRGRVLADNAPLDAHTKLFLFLFSLVVATLSWWLVETPFRKGALRPQRRALFLTNGIAALVLLAIGVTMLATHGAASRFSDQQVEIMNYLSYHPATEWRENVCFLTPSDSFQQFQPGTCLAEVPGHPQFLLLGDSLAAQLYPGLTRAFTDLNFSQANSADCIPFLVQPPSLRPPFAANCKQMTQFIYSNYLLQHHPSAVLLAASWRPADLDGLGRTIDWLKQHHLRIIVFGPVPEYDTAVPRLLALAMRTRDPSAILRAHRYPVSVELDRRMAKLAREQWKVGYISAFDDLCNSQVEMVAKSQLQSGDGCPVLAAPGVPLEFDFHHLTVPGSILYAQNIKVRHQLP